MLEDGFDVLHELQLDPEVFRLIAIPADLYTLGTRERQGGKLQALAGGDKRFGGTHDVVSFSTDYASAKVFARFAVVQRKRMMDWQN